VSYLSKTMGRSDVDRGYQWVKNTCIAFFKWTNNNNNNSKFV